MSADIEKKLRDQGIIPDTSQQALNETDAGSTEIAPDVPAPKSEYEILSNQMDKLRADKNAEAQAADAADRKRMMIASAFKVLGTAGQADIQRRVGQKVGIDKFVAPKSANSGSKVLKERDSMLQDLRDKYKMLQEKNHYETRQEQRTEDIEAKKQAVKDAQAQSKIDRDQDKTDKKDAQAQAKADKEIERKFKAEESQKDRDSRAEIAASKKGNGLSKAQVAVDTDYAKLYNKFSGTGRTNAVHAINKLEELQKEVAADIGFGEAGGTRLPLPDMMRSRLAVERRDDARNFANTTLKELFGGQLSDGEREAAAREFWNDSLDNESNSKRLTSKIKNLQDNLTTQTNKAVYYENNGTLKGYKSISSEEKSSGSDAQKILDMKVDKVMAANPGVSREKIIELLKKKGKI